MENPPAFLDLRGEGEADVIRLAFELDLRVGGEGSLVDFVEAESLHLHLEALKELHSGASLPDHGLGADFALPLPLVDGGGRRGHIGFGVGLVQSLRRSVLEPVPDIGDVSFADDFVQDSLFYPQSFLFVHRSAFQ